MWESLKRGAGPTLRLGRGTTGLKAGLRAEVVVVRTAVVEASAKLGL